MPVGSAVIPVTTFRKCYWNMSTGLWATDQDTGASIGSTGYNGFSLSSSLDTSYMDLGNGAFSATNNVAIFGFSELQGVFDQCKIDRIDYEFWFSNPSREQSGTIHDAPELFIARDPDNADPPSALGGILQYQNVYRVLGNANNGVFKVSVYPKVRYSIGVAADEAGTSTTLSGVQPAGFQDAQKPSGLHFALRGWFVTNSSQAATLGYLHIKERQIRRYKITK